MLIISPTQSFFMLCAAKEIEWRLHLKCLKTFWRNVSLLILWYTTLWSMDFAWETWPMMLWNWFQKWKRMVATWMQLHMKQPSTHFLITMKMKRQRNFSVKWFPMVYSKMKKMEKLATSKVIHLFLFSFIFYLNGMTFLHCLCKLQIAALCTWFCNKRRWTFTSVLFKQESKQIIVTSTVILILYIGNGGVWT